MSRIAYDSFVFVLGIVSPEKEKTRQSMPGTSIVDP